VVVGIVLPMVLHHRQVLGGLSIPAASVLAVIGGFVLRAVVVLSSQAIRGIGAA